MTTLAEEACWARLRQELEQHLESWQVPAPEDYAEGFVWELRRSGWRTPLPDHDIRTERSTQRPVLRPEAVQRHAAACREALRAGRGNV